jgi:hypothetical protein
MPNQTSHRLLSFTGWVWLIVACFWWADWGCAQTVILHLRNGDRLSGRLLSETTNTVVISTAFSEKVSIGKDLVERREEVATPNTASVTNQPAAVSPAKTPQVPATGVASELVPTNKPSMAQAAGGAKTPETKPKKPEPSLFHKFLSEWQGEAQLGANLGFSTKDREAFTGHIKLVNNHKFVPIERNLRNILDYDVSYSTTDGVLADNRMEGTWKTEYDLSKRFIIYNALDAGYDEVRGIDLQYDFGPGVGYKWVVLTNFVFKTELGGNYQEQYFVHDKQTSIYSLRLAEDAWWQITKKVRWDEKVEFYPNVEDFTAYRIRLETNLSYLLKDNLTLSLNVVDLYDTTVPVGVSNNDLQIRSLIGIKF